VYTAIATSRADDAAPRANRHDRERRLLDSRYRPCRRDGGPGSWSRARGPKDAARLGWLRVPARHRPRRGLVDARAMETHPGGRVPHIADARIPTALAQVPRPLAALPRRVWWQPLCVVARRQFEM